LSIGLGCCVPCTSCFISFVELISGVSLVQRKVFVGATEKAGNNREILLPAHAGSRCVNKTVEQLSAFASLLLKMFFNGIG